MGRQKKNSYWGKIAPECRKPGCERKKKKKKLHFSLHMSVNQRFASPGLLTVGRGPKERIKHHEVSVP